MNGKEVQAGQMLGARPELSLRLAIVLLFALVNGAIDIWLLASSDHGSPTQSSESWIEYAGTFWPYGISILLLAMGGRSFSALAAGMALSAALISLIMSVAFFMGWVVAVLSGYGIALLLWLLSHGLVAYSSKRLMKDLPDQKRNSLAGIVLVVAYLAILVAINNARHPWGAQ